MRDVPKFNGDKKVQAEYAEAFRRQRQSEQEPVELEADDLEPIPESAAVDSHIRTADEGPLVAQTEHQSITKEELKARGLRIQNKLVEAWLDAGQDPEIVRARLEASLETAQDNLADAANDALRSEAEGAVETAESQLAELDRLVAEREAKDEQKSA